MIDGKHLSITTGCLNRVDFLRQALKTWLALSEPDEIVIVDWNNEVPLSESLSDFDDPRLVLARVIDQPFWKNAKCHNLELELAKGELILRLDSDYLLGDNFLTSHPISKGHFYAGNWKPYTGDIDKCSLAGTLYAYREDVLAVNGYNEWLMYYGSEDDDLFERMAASGLSRTDIDLSTISHISHSDHLRYENLEVTGELSHRGLDRNGTHTKLHLVHNSRSLARAMPWTTSDRRTPWSISRQLDKAGRFSALCTEKVDDTGKSDCHEPVVFSGRKKESIPFIQAITTGKTLPSPVVEVKGNDSPIFSTETHFDRKFVALLFNVLRQEIRRVAVQRGKASGR